MKQGAAINKIVMGLFFLAILLYLGGAAWKGLNDPYPSVQAFAFALDDTIETTGYLVRTEQVLTGSGGIVRLTPAEGEKVAAGATVALLYANEEALERDQQLELLQNEETQLVLAIEAAADESGAQGERTSQSVTDALVKLRASVAAGDFTRLESQTTTYKNAVYRQSQRNGSTDALVLALSATRSEIDTLRAAGGEKVGRVTVPQSGIFSGQVDGYESLLTPDRAMELTPADLDELFRTDADRSAPEGALAKLITDSTWYFVCPLTEEGASRLAVGESVTVRFSRDWSGEVDMTVEKIGRTQGDRVPVVFSSNRFLSDTTLLRRQTVSLVFAQQKGIRVPTAALRVERETGTDPDTGEENEVQVTCVYVRVGVTAERKPVRILAQGEDYYLVAPLMAQDASATQQKKALRAGDEVILARGEIWDGKVLE